MTAHPSMNLVAGQNIEVTVSGFGRGGKFFVSECADVADANSAGCGNQLAAQPFGVTDDSGHGSFTFSVVATAGATPDNATGIRACANKCVLVATVGKGHGYATTPLAFTNRE